MIRFCACLIWLAVESLLSIGIDQIVRVWLAVRPIRRLKERRAARKAAKRGESVQPDEVPMTNEILLLILRHGLTFAGGAGLFTENELGQLSAAVATLVGLLWSGYRKWKRAKQAA